MGDMPLIWGARVGSEGAPLMVADLSIYAHWRGSRSSLKPGFRFTAWGGLAAELRDAIPTEVSYANRAEAYPALERLVDAVRSLHPEARFQAAGWTPNEPAASAHFLESMKVSGADDHTVLVEGQGRLRIVFKDETDYDRVAMAKREDRAEAFVAPFANGGVALWQTLGGCVADIGTTRGGEIDEFVLLSHSYDGRDDRKKKRALYKGLSARSLAEEPRGEVDFPEGVVIIADSSFFARDFVREGVDAEAVEVLRSLAALRGPMPLNAEAILGVGTVLNVAKGTYALLEGRPDLADWDGPLSARWCRLRRV